MSGIHSRESEQVRGEEGAGLGGGLLALVGARVGWGTASTSDG